MNFHLISWFGDLMKFRYFTHYLAKIKSKDGNIGKPLAKSVFRTQSNICDANARSSHRRCSVKKSALRNFAKFTGKHLR